MKFDDGSVNSQILSIAEKHSRESSDYLDYLSAAAAAEDLPATSLPLDEVRSVKEMFYEISSIRLNTYTR